MSTDAKKTPNGGISRRDFLQGIAGTAAQVGVLTALPACSSEGDGSPNPPPADGRKGTLEDVKHVVIFMQENRSFDHYFGTMKGVRGFSDRTALPLRSGKNAFYQPDASRTDGKHLLPFRVDTKKVNGQQLGDLAHGWGDQHNAVADGANDAWVEAKSSQMTMAYFTEADIPFHHALADAYTICDHNFCSVLGPTTPNRLHLFSGTIDADGKYGPPLTRNPSDYNPVFSWPTYPERLQEKGISWRVYANAEVGDETSDHPFVGDYGDNPLWLFHAYHDALKDPKKRELADRAAVREGWEPDSGKGKDVTHVLGDFIQDCKTNKLPKVSWVVAPYGYSEHPEARPIDGAAYLQAIIDALASNKEIWESTVLIVNYDENDGFFDHVPPPIPPQGTPGEWIEGRPVGFGPRVPMLIISPWSRGGWVSSEIFDHTSVIRFLEKWTGVAEPNISSWRRAMAGDLTSCFDFSKIDVSTPPLPDTATLRKQADDAQPGLPTATPPEVGKQEMPVQTPGTRKARPLPYQPLASVSVDVAGRKLGLSLANSGAGTLQLLAVDYLNLAAPNRYDLGPKSTQKPVIDITSTNGTYALTVHGPNRFMASFAGDLNTPGARVEVAASISGEPSAPKLVLTLTNGSAAAVKMTIKALYYRDDGPWTYELQAGENKTTTWDPYERGQGWYDLEVSLDGDTAFSRRFTGRLENGSEGVTG